MIDGAALRGHAYLSYLEPLREEREVLLSAVVEALPEESRAFFDSEIYADRWYPRSHLHALLSSVESAVLGDQRELRELGAMSARFQISAIFRALLATGTPPRLLARLGAIWRRQSTGGELRLASAEGPTAVLLLADAELPPQFPIVLAGWVDTALRLVGATPYPTLVRPRAPGEWTLAVKWLEGSSESG